MYLLDTDHISLMDRGGTEGQKIRARLARVPPDAVSASIVSFEEQIRGWMSAIARARVVERQIPFYRELERLLRFYSVTPLLTFDAQAASEVRRFQQAGIRIGTMDLKIAALALANNATLLSRNRAPTSARFPACASRTGRSEATSTKGARRAVPTSRSCRSPARPSSA